METDTTNHNKIMKLGTNIILCLDMDFNIEVHGLDIFAWGMVIYISIASAIAQTRWHKAWTHAFYGNQQFEVLTKYRYKALMKCVRR